MVSNYCRRFIFSKYSLNSRSYRCVELNTPLFIHNVNNSQNITVRKLDLIYLYRPYSNISYARMFHSSSLAYRKKTTEVPEKAKRVLKFIPKLKHKIDSSKTIEIWKNMTIRELAEALGKQPDHVFEVLEFIKDAGTYNNRNSKIDKIHIIQAIAKKSGFKSTIKATQNIDVEEYDEETILSIKSNESKLIKKRPPVITIMGHVDHGKTTLLDTLRDSSIVSQEFGGITQHIGAFSVKISSGETVTFLDTPGHAAFSAMRARGAVVTDIIVLVVAADDGVMEQTIESLKHAEDAKVPVIVAINKIDKPSSKIESCKKELLRQGIQLEEYGGQVQCVPISAAKGTNVDLLMETILTQAELMELQADYQGMVEGTIIESWTDTSRGKLCTALIQQGTLKKSDYLVAGTAWVKVRAMLDENVQIVQEASPSTPVQIIGWKELPSAGEKIIEVISEKHAQKLVSLRLNKLKAVKAAEDFEVISKKMEEHYSEYRKQRMERLLKTGKVRKSRVHERKQHSSEDSELKLMLIIKGDVDGSVEAILDVLETYDSPLCSLDIIHYGVGNISKTDVEMASMFKGIIYGFNVSTHSDAVGLSKTEKVPLKHFNIIYRMVDDIKQEINRRLPLVSEDRILGEATILQEFLINEGKVKWPVAGCRCESGVLNKSAKFRVMHQNNSIFQGALLSMKHLKNEVQSIKKGVECGLRFDNATFRFTPGDVIQCYETVKVKQSIKWNPGF